MSLNDCKTSSARAAAYGTTARPSGRCAESLRIQARQNGSEAGKAWVEGNQGVPYLMRTSGHLPIPSGVCDVTSRVSTGASSHVVSRERDPWLN